MSKIETALVSVSDKTGLPDFVQGLRDFGVQIISTGGTADLLRDHDIKVRDVADYTGFPEILDGRVKTLHPKVHGGVLARRGQQPDEQQLDEFGIETIDMVVVNLYPFEETIARPDVDLMEAVESIDIGGSTLIRAAAKNYTHVAVVTSPERYGEIIDEMEQTGGHLRERTHYELALEAFQHSSHYDAAIARYLGRIGQEPGTHRDLITVELKKKQELRYGENPHQSAAFYVESGRKEPSVSSANQIAGPELSFNNILDIDAGMELVKEFDLPMAVCVKHTSLSGAGSAESIHEAYRAAYLGDPKRGLGGVVVLNRPFDVPTAELVARFRATEDGEKLEHFVAAIAAPEIHQDAVKTLYNGVNWACKVRLLETGSLCATCIDESEMDMRKVVGGMLVQDRNLLGFNEAAVTVPTDCEPTDGQMRDLAFAWLCCKHQKSNSTVLAADRAMVGAAVGHMSRAESTQVAIQNAAGRARGAVMATDGFIVSEEPVEWAAEAGITAIIQPGGGEHQESVVSAANRHGIPMVLGGVRHFRH